MYIQIYIYTCVWFVVYSSLSKYIYTHTFVG